MKSSVPASFASKPALFLATFWQHFAGLLLGVNGG
jgi:hypothetical protein